MEWVEFGSDNESVPWLFDDSNPHRNHQERDQNDKDMHAEEKTEENTSGKGVEPTVKNNREH
jgi:hypothetical protein